MGWRHEPAEGRLLGKQKVFVRSEESKIRGRAAAGTGLREEVQGS